MSEEVQDNPVQSAVEGQAATPEEIVESQQPEQQVETESFVDGPANDADAQNVVDDVLGSQSIDDPFGELMADAKDNVPGTEAQEPQEAQPEVEMPAEQPQKADDQSFQYWQSQADKRSKELEEVKSRYQDLEEIAPIARYIRENPQVLNSVESSLSANNSQETLTQENSENLAKNKPSKPNKPANYDPMEATSDPESDSFKYRESMEEYRDGMMDFYESRERVRDAEVQRNQEQAAQVQYMDNVRTQLNTVYGFGDKETEAFIADMSRPESLSLENLVTVWKLKNKPTEQQIKAPKKVQAMKSQAEKLAVKQPVGVQPSQGQVARGVEDQLMDAMVANYKSKNPW